MTVPKRSYNTHPVAIIGGDNPNVLGLARALGRAGIGVYFFATQPAPIASRSRFVRRTIHIGCNDGQELYGQLMRHVKEIAVNGGPPFLIFTNEQQIAVCATWEGALLEHYQVITNIGRAHELCSKSRQLSLAAQAGFKIPYTVVVENLADIGRQSRSFRFPVIVKPDSPTLRGRFAEKAAIYHTTDELREGLKEVLTEGNCRLLLQEYVPGGDNCIAFFVAACGHGGEVLAHVTGKKTRQWPPGRGVMCSGRSIPIPELSRLAVRLCRLLGLAGLIGIEGKYHAHTHDLYFIEANVRSEMIISIADASGVNLPLIAYLHALGQSLPNCKQQRVALWLNAVDDFRCARELIRRGELTWGAYLRSLTGPKTYPVFTWDDPLPFMAWCWKTIAGRLWRIMLLINALCSFLGALRPFKHVRHVADVGGEGGTTDIASR